MLILDHMHHRMHNNLPDETQLPNGQVRKLFRNREPVKRSSLLKIEPKLFLFWYLDNVSNYNRILLTGFFLRVQKFELLSLALLGVPSMAEKFLEISDNLKQLCFDSADYVCLKFILLLNAGKRKERDSRDSALDEVWKADCRRCRDTDNILKWKLSGEVRNLNNKQHVHECSEQV